MHAALRALQAPFDPRGRVGRRSYWKAISSCWGIILLAGIAGMFANGPATTPALVVFTAAAPWASALTMRRLRDAGTGSWLVPATWSCAAIASAAAWVWVVTAAAGLEPGMIEAIVAIVAGAVGLALAGAALVGTLRPPRGRVGRSQRLGGQKKGAAAEAPRPPLSFASRLRARDASAP